MAQVESKLCCNCIHYVHGKYEEPCAKGNKYCGYLKEECYKWEKEPGEADRVIYKKCSICNELLPLDKFFKRRDSKDGYSDFCKICRPQYWNERKKKKES